MTLQNSGRIKLVLILILGVLSVSMGSIFVRLSQEAPSITISFYRMAIASALLTPWFLRRRKRAFTFRLSARIVAGVFLAFHFAFWIASLRYTSVAVSVLLVNTSPLLVALLSYFLFKERLTTTGVLGILLSFAGSVVLFWNDLSIVGDWRGATFALLGAVMLGAYLLAGRELRQTLSVVDYVYPTYLIATAALFLLATFSEAPLSGFSPSTYLCLLALGAIPQVLGHTSYNWALERLTATSVSMLIMAEPFLASLLAWWMLNEPIGKTVLLGAIPVVAGILLVVRWGVRSPNLPRSIDFIDVAIVVPIHEERVWIRKRINTGHLDGYWEFPGGKLQEGEQPLQAALREFREETGVSLEGKHVTHWETLSFEYPERKVRLHAYLGQISDPGRLHQGKWVACSDLEQLKTPPANKPLIEQLSREFGRGSKQRARARAQPKDSRGD